MNGIGATYLRIVLSRWKLILALVFTCTLLAWAVSQFYLAQKPKFEAAARLNIVPTAEELGYASRFVRGSTFDGGSVAAEAVCHAPDGADCRLTGLCECEAWGEIRRTADKIWHRIVDGSETEPQWHEVKPADYCNVCMFINESGCVDDLGAGTFVIGEVPIEPARPLRSGTPR